MAKSRLVSGWLLLMSLGCVVNRLKLQNLGWSFAVRVGLLILIVVRGSRTWKNGRDLL